MNKVLIVEASESDRRLMSGLLVKHGYEPIAIETMEAAKEEVEKLPPGAMIVTAMKFTLFVRAASPDHEVQREVTLIG